MTTRPMRLLFTLPLLVLFTFSAFAHAGEVHKYMGTVATVHDDGSFMLDKTDGSSMHVAIAATTKWRHADGRAASQADLVSGKRVVVTISTDGKTASEVKLAAPKKPAK